MTDLELCNLALGIFDRQITQTELDAVIPNKEVRLCRQHLPLARNKVLREFDWSFLIVKLGIDYTQDSGGYKGFIHGYSLPEGVFKVVHAHTDYAYEIANGTIYTDEDSPEVYGIMQTLPSSGVPSDYIELTAYALAFSIAPMLAPAGGLDQVALQKYSWVLSGLISSECHNNSRPRPVERW